jgi:hypothetical protein
MTVNTFAYGHYTATDALLVRAACRRNRVTIKVPMLEDTRIPHRCDPWRKRMSHTAETLRRLDESRFRAQISKIEECLRVDANWNLEAALASSKRRWSPLQPASR